MPSTTRTRISARAVLTVLGTLAVGVALGVLGTNMVYQHRIAEFYRMRTPAGFIERVEDIVQPRNEVQRAQIRPACKRAADRMSAISSYSHELRSNVVDSMQASLQPILATDQQNRLHEWASRFHSHGKHHKQSHDE